MTVFLRIVPAITLFVLLGLAVACGDDPGQGVPQATPQEVGPVGSAEDAIRLVVQEVREGSVDNSVDEETATAERMTETEARTLVGEDEDVCMQINGVPDREVWLVRVHVTIPSLSADPGTLIRFVPVEGGAESGMFLADGHHTKSGPCPSYTP